MWNRVDGIVVSAYQKGRVHSLFWTAIRWHVSLQVGAFLRANCFAFPNNLNYRGEQNYCLGRVVDVG
jgi:hypothetical protein